jgi:glycosyltransferase involved in cell wall biosynthesis
LNDAKQSRSAPSVADGPFVPTVSVIVPNYNHARYLRERVDSVLGQTYQDFEVIVLDDGSTDESRSIIREYENDPRVRIEFNDTNSGSTFKQWNKGVRLACGKYVWIAESDDYADKHLLERLVPSLDAQPNTVLVYCRSWRISADGKTSGFADSPVPGQDRWMADFVVDGREECLKYLVQCNTIPNASAVLFRRDVYELVGGADENLRLCSDWKLWSAMALAGRIAYVAQPLNYFRFHNLSVRVQIQQPEVMVEYLEVIRSMVQRMTPQEPGQRTLYGDVFESTILDGFRSCIDVFGRSDPEATLCAIDGFLRLSDSGYVNRWEVADAWLRAAGIHYRQGRQVKALLFAVRGFLIRPVVAGRPVKRMFTRIAATLNG